MNERALAKTGEQYYFHTEIDRAPVTISESLGWVTIKVIEARGSILRPYKTTCLSFTHTDAKFLAAAIEQLTKALEVRR